MAHKISFNEEARTKLKSGVDQVANAVKQTLGPRGKNVIIEKGSLPPKITKDGVTVARAIELEDREEAQGAKLIKEVASKTNDKIGDGTSTASLLAQHLLNNGLKRLTAGYQATDLVRDMNNCLVDVKEELAKITQKITNDKEVEQIASISANSKELGKMISDVIKDIGPEGVILVEESFQDTETKYEVTKGMRFNKGYVAPFMVTNPERLEAVYENALVLITDKKIVSQLDIAPLMENLAKNHNKTELVIICDNLEGEAMMGIAVNAARGLFNTLVVKAPEFGETKKKMLEDLAMLTGGKLIDTEGGMQLKDVTVEDLGRADKVVVSADYTTIVGGKGEQESIDERVKKIKAELKNSESDFEKKKIRIRLGNLAGGVGVIKVAAPTEPERVEIRDRVEDAVAATKAALDDGILPGGGTSLVKAYHAISEKWDGCLLKNALLEPVKQIAQNAGEEGVEVLAKVKEGVLTNQFFGFDAEEGEYLDDMVKAGIVDPAKVVKTALDNAVSIANSVINSAVLITEKPEEKKEKIGQ